MTRINTRAELLAVKKRLGVRADWHEPDEQDVTAKVFGKCFDNAGFWGYGFKERPGTQEMFVVLFQDGYPVAEVNLATLFALATGYKDGAK